MKRRLLEIANYYGLSIRKFESECGLLRGNISNMADDGSIGTDKLAKIIDRFSSVNLNWVITGRGDMLKSVTEGEILKRETATTVPQLRESKKLIPFYDDIASIGGMNERIVNMESRPVSEWIDAGDWFKEATAAIRHYGDSMTEYPSGCILAIKEVMDINLVVWGKNYVIETDEYRITKRLQRGRANDQIRAYSSNEETYQDGTLIHEPVDIPMISIRKLALVLGCVVKQESSGMVYIK